MRVLYRETAVTIMDEVVYPVPAPNVIPNIFAYRIC
jgi:hypothetical protein